MSFLRVPTATRISRSSSIGIRNAELVQIADGVKGGDSVIISGGYALPDKTKIKMRLTWRPTPMRKPSPGRTAIRKRKRNNCAMELT